MSINRDAIEAIDVRDYAEVPLHGKPISTAYELHAVIEEAGPALFHTGHSDMGSGLPAGGGRKYSNPRYVDDLAAHLPGMPIVLPRPSSP